MAQSIDIKRRIKSITSTKKITKAMELVSAAKMKKAVSAVLASRPYANLCWQAAHNLTLALEGKAHPLLETRQPKKIAIILISTNRGLCGGFNTQLVNYASNFIKTQNEKVEKIDIITFGKKGRDLAIRNKYNVIADYAKNDITQSSTDVFPIIEFIVREYKEKNYDRVYMAYTDYISSLVQKPHIFQLLPLNMQVQDENLGQVKKFGEKTKEEKSEEQSASKHLYLFEPRESVSLEYILPRLLEVLTYQAVLETEASEHSARMMSMRNASDAAADMINEMTLIYNKARQTNITKELAEISGAAAALQN